MAANFDSSPSYMESSRDSLGTPTTTSGDTERLAQALAKGQGLAQVIAANALINAGAASVDALDNLLNSENDAVRWRAVNCLAHIHSEKAIDPLLRALHDPSQGIAWKGADGLLKLGPGASKQVLRSVLEQPLTYVTILALRHYAENASPRSLFRPVVLATHKLGSMSATLTAVATALQTLSDQRD
jgi:HEAT repeat protein